MLLSDDKCLALLHIIDMVVAVFDPAAAQIEQCAGWAAHLSACAHM